MQKIEEAASEFLANRRVAVTGVSRQAKNHGSNVVYQRLRAGLKRAIAQLLGCPWQRCSVHSQTVSRRRPY